jgi:hypothetical protein
VSQLQVFTSEAIDRIRRTYADFPDHRKPAVYWIATDPEHQATRLRIDEWVSLLPDEMDDDDRRRSIRKNVIKRLKSADNFWDTYNELYVGDILRQLGYVVDYERPIPNAEKLKTPDWYVESKDNAPPFYVEVFTPGQSRHRRENDNKWEDLRIRLKKIPLSVGLSLRANEQCAPPAERQSITITRRVREWLESCDPPTGEVLRLDCDTLEEVKDEFAFHFRRRVIEIEVSCREGIREGQGWCVGPFPFERVEVESLKNNIRRKTRKYAEHLEESRIPLVVFLIPHSESPLSHESVDDAVQGQSVTRVYPLSDGRNLIMDGRELNGLFAHTWPGSSALSTIVWWREVTAWPLDSDQQPIHKPIKLYFNLGATNPLPPYALDFRRIGKEISVWPTDAYPL